MGVLNMVRRGSDTYTGGGEYPVRCESIVVVVVAIGFSLVVLGRDEM